MKKVYVVFSVKSFVWLTRKLNYFYTTQIKHTLYRRFGFTLEIFIRTDFRGRRQIKNVGWTRISNAQSASL